MERRAKPTRRRLGREIAAARKRSRKSQAQVARALRVVQSTVSAWERGTRGLQRKQAEDLDRLFGTSGVVQRAWNRANTPDVLPESYEEVERLEESTSELREYQPLVFPGLVQCESYLRGLLADATPWRSSRETEQMVTARLKRQKILEKKDPPLVSIVMEEWVLRRAVRGGKAVLREQLSTVLHLIDQNKIRLQVIPSNAECHPGASGPFCLYTFPDKPMVASAEHTKGEHFMDDMMQVQHCSTLFGILQSEALPPPASRELIRKAKKELDDQA